MPLLLPAHENIALAIDKGEDEDYDLIRLYYSWYAGWFYRHRLQLVADLLPKQRLNAILEVGTGSGILIKELLQHSEKITAIDIHESYTGIRSMLEREGVDLNRVELRQGSIFEIPAPDNSFDAVVCISVLEHFADPGPAIQEMRRVVKPDGMLALGFPARNSITDTLFRLLGYTPKHIHPASHHTILEAIEKQSVVEKKRVFPMKFLPMYVACKVRLK